MVFSDQRMYKNEEVKMLTKTTWNTNDTYVEGRISAYWSTVSKLNCQHHENILNSISENKHQIDEESSDVVPNDQLIPEINKRFK